MIPISLCWDTQRRWVLLKWNGFVSSGWQNGKMVIKILGVPVPFAMKKKKIQLPSRLPIQWRYLKGFFSFLTEWRVKRVEGTFSLPDLMMNGILYGWMSAIQTGEPDRRIEVTVNFSGENWLKGEFTISLKTLFRHFRSWGFPLIREMREKKSKKGGETHGSH